METQTSTSLPGLFGTGTSPEVGGYRVETEGVGIVKGPSGWVPERGS